MIDTIKSDIENLRKNSAIAYIGSVDEDGYPQIKAIMVLEHGSVKEQYFSTNTSSKRVGQFLKNPKASVYYCDHEQFKGALFTGTIEVCTDHDTKALLWNDNALMYYQDGIDDEDYCVYKFIAESVNYYHQLSNITISIDEL